MMKALPWILFGIALPGAIYLFVLLLNAGMILDNARSQTAHLRERSDLALIIVRKDWVGKDTARVLELFKELERQGVVVGPESSSAFAVGDFIFETKGGVVTEVRYID